MSVVDVWMQHPTLRHSNHEMFESLRHWTGRGLLEKQLPVAVTVSALEAAEVEIGLSAAWYGPHGALISNDEEPSSPPSRAGGCVESPAPI